MKTNVVIYANCQGVAVAKYLQLYSQSENLDITCLENYKFTTGLLNLDDYLEPIRRADKFLFHPLQAKWGRLSTTAGEDNIVAMLKRECELLTFPYVYNDALWPLIQENDTFLRNHAALDCYLNEGAECADLIELYNAGRLDFGFAERLTSTLDYLRYMERDTDIKVSDFVANNVLRVDLFTTSNHPTNTVFAQIVPGIAKFLFGGDVEPVIHIESLDQSYPGLPGYLPIDRYCIDDLGIRFKTSPDEWAGDYYRALISNYCAQIALAAPAVA
jgi:hypothetical protein